MINPKCRISNTVFDEFDIQIRKTRSIKDVSTSLGISYSRGYIHFENMELKKYSNENTTIVYMDEFKGNSNNEKYQLAIYNQKRKLIEILENRKSNRIREYFKNNRIKPNIFVIDMFMQFRNAIKSIFDKGIIIVDKYHLLKQSDWMLRDIRIRLFNSNIRYKNLKRYWKLLSKHPTSRYTRKQKYKLNKLFELSNELKIIYDFRKKLYYLFSARDDIKFKKGIDNLILELDNSKILEANRLSDTLTEIINACIYNINNGFVEG